METKSIRTNGVAQREPEFIGEPLIVERTFDIPSPRVWNAITNNTLMKHWYFDIESFEPKIGFEFHFSVGNAGKTYTHLCKITQLVPGRKIAYSWRYENYPGHSEVTFELFPQGEKTLLRLTHKGIASFPAGDPDFARESFTAGWNHIIGISLKDYLEALPKN